MTGTAAGGSGRFTARTLIDVLSLEPHPEGGHFREVYRSSSTVTRNGDRRSALTTIYFLLDRGEHSRWHVVASDEAWHFYGGDPVELVTCEPGGTGLERSLLGPVGHEGALPVHVVPAGHWQAARSLGAYGLVGCTVGPGFDFADFAMVADLDGHDEAFSSRLAPYRGLL